MYLRETGSNLLTMYFISHCGTFQIRCHAGGNVTPLRLRRQQFLGLNPLCCLADRRQSSLIRHHRLYSIRVFIPSSVVRPANDQHCRDINAAVLSPLPSSLPPPPPPQGKVGLVLYMSRNYILSSLLCSCIQYL